MRHDESASTDAYVEKITLKEEVEMEYRMNMDPIARALNAEALPQVCRDCSSNRVCRHIDEVPEWMTGCKYKPTLKKNLSIN